MFNVLVVTFMNIIPVIKSEKRKVGGLRWNVGLNRLVAENG